MEAFVITMEGKFGPCEECGKEAGLAPFGKDGAYICSECGEKPENEARGKKLVAEMIRKATGQSRYVHPNQAN